VGTAYIPCAVLVVVYVIKETASRDLLYVTLMLAPWAIITAWTLGTQSFVDLQTGYLNSQQLQYYARELVASFVVLAISSFVFARLKPRWGKALALVLPLAAVNGYVVVRLWSEVSLWGLLVSAIAVLLVSVPTLWDFRE
jgi:FtsH-binding integral membrane protein